MVMSMKRFIEGENRYQSTLFPERLDDYIVDDNAVRVVDAFVEKLDLLRLGFEGVIPESTGRPGYHPAMMLKLYIYGYLNRIQSSRRLEREAQRNVELIWLTGRLIPAFKTIADFRKDNREAICTVCFEFIELCRELQLFSGAGCRIGTPTIPAENPDRESGHPPESESGHPQFQQNRDTYNSGITGARGPTLASAENWLRMDAD
jgi:transposase